MPRRKPQFSGGLIFHVLNRGVRRMQLFDRDGDYRAYLNLFAKAQRRVPVKCLAYCLMPNHFHFVLRPDADGDMSRFMFWLSTVHAKRWHLAHGSHSNGHVYQGRFKAFAVCEDGHFLRVCRYVERNPMRAGLVGLAQDWPWSSLAQRGHGRQVVQLTDWPVERPAAWDDLVNDVETDAKEIREAIRRSSPFGPDRWRERVARELGIERTLRAPWRPREPKPGLLFADGTGRKK